MLMAALLAAALPAASAKMAEELRSHPALALLWGLLTLVCIPVAAILLLITIIGIPLALLAILLFFALLLVGHVVAAASLADLALRRYKPEASARIAWRAGAAIVAALALALLARIPVLGGLIALVAMLLGVGVFAAWALRPAPAPAQ